MSNKFKQRFNLQTFFLITFLLNIEVSAQDTSGFHDLALKRVDQAKKLLEKTNKCYFALMNFPNERAALDKRIWSSPGFAPSDVTCIENIVVQPGTIHEMAGCALVSFNLNTGNYEKYGRFINDPQSIVPIKCEKGGLEKLLQTKFESQFYENEPPTVAEEIFSPPLGRMAPSRFVLIFARDLKVKNWFEEFSKAVTKRKEAKLQKKK